ncbi:MAG: hypothetical protein E7180_04220 [Erysipelotrichaceae bacterium]|nr:hypothetical protein [Erysipelotrichaceae bacterium]
MKLKSFQKKMCAVSTFIAIIAYVLVSHFTSCWTWTLFIFLIIPLMPVLVGLKKLTLSYDLLVVIVYLILGFAIGGWHPWWVLFLTIPIYHIFVDDIKRKKKLNKFFAKDEDKEEVDVEIID